MAGFRGTPADALACCACRGQFADARTLACLHTVCKQCLLLRVDGDTTTCPACGYKLRTQAAVDCEADDVPPSYFLRNFLDGVPEPSREADEGFGLTVKTTSRGAPALQPILEARAISEVCTRQ